MPSSLVTPDLGRIVRYQSKTGDYELAAIICRNTDSSSDVAIARSADFIDGGLAVLDRDASEVDLTVFTPGVCGTYPEHSIPYDPDGAPGTWRWHTDS